MPTTEGTCGSGTQHQDWWRPDLATAPDRQPRRRRNPVGPFGPIQRKPLPGDHPGRKKGSLP